MTARLAKYSSNSNPSVGTTSNLTGAKIRLEDAAFQSQRSSVLSSEVECPTFDRGPGKVSNDNISSQHLKKRQLSIHQTEDRGGRSTSERITIRIPVSSIFLAPSPKKQVSKAVYDPPEFPNLSCVASDNGVMADTERFNASDWSTSESPIMTAETIPANYSADDTENWKNYALDDGKPIGCSKGASDASGYEADAEDRNFDDIHT